MKYPKKKPYVCTVSTYFTKKGTTHYCHNTRQKLDSVGNCKQCEDCETHFASILFYTKCPQTGKMAGMKVIERGEDKITIRCLECGMEATETPEAIAKYTRHLPKGETQQ